jgi:hypothetical protein
MWAELLRDQGNKPIQTDNPMRLVTVECASKRMHKPLCLTDEEF